MEHITCNGEYTEIMDKMKDGVNIASSGEHDEPAEQRTEKEGFRTVPAKTNCSKTTKDVVAKSSELTSERHNWFLNEHGMSLCCSPHILMKRIRLQQGLCIYVWRMCCSIQSRSKDIRNN